jgi:hypothetical protein
MNEGKPCSKPASFVALLLGLSFVGCDDDSKTSARDEPTETSGGAGSSAQTAAAAPTQVTAPLSVSLPTGRAYQMDTTTPEVAGVVHGSTGLELSARLADPSGRRALHLKAQDGTTADVAGSGWSILPVASADDSGPILVCWSQLRGESLDGEMPHPSAGMQLLCRHGTIDALGATFDAGHDLAPTWLSNISGDTATGFEIRYIRTGSGWLFGPAQPGDGIFARSYDGTTLGETRRLYPE